MRITALSGAALILANASGFPAPLSEGPESGEADFTFALLGDSHLMGEKNPRLTTRLKAATMEINRLEPQPDFVVFMGDAVQDGSDEQFRRFRQVIGELRPKVYFIPGEHDWYLDLGESYRTFISPVVPPFSVVHKGARLIFLNGIHLADYWTEKKLTPAERMEAAGKLDRPPGPFQFGSAQLEWLAADLAKVDRSTPLYLFVHPPIYDYYRKWNFWVSDADRILTLLKPFSQVSVFHGHVHHLVRNRIGNIRFYSTLSTSWPYPYPVSGVPSESVRKMPRPNPARFYDGLGWSLDRTSKGNVEQEDIQWTLHPPES